MNKKPILPVFRRFFNKFYLTNKPQKINFKSTVLFSSSHHFWSVWDILKLFEKFYFFQNSRFFIKNRKIFAHYSDLKKITIIKKDEKSIPQGLESLKRSRYTILQPNVFLQLLSSTFPTYLPILKPYHHFLFHMIINE